MIEREKLEVLVVRMQMSARRVAVNVEKMDERREVTVGAGRQAYKDGTSVLWCVRSTCQGLCATAALGGCRPKSHSSLPFLVDA